MDLPDRKINQRTLQQNKALHLWYKQLADALNDAGYDMKQVLKPNVAIPWNERMVKEHLWRPVEKAVIGETSTTKLETVDVSAISDIINRHLSEKFGVFVPFPNLEILLHDYPTK